MHLMNVMVKGRVLNILLPVLSLLRAERTVASSLESLSNFTVNRTPGFVDSFTFKAPKSRNTNCSLENPDICASYGGIQQKTKCETKELCCEACQCVKERPTFLVHKQRCVEDKNITEKSGRSKSGKWELWFRVCQVHVSPNSVSLIDLISLDMRDLNKNSDNTGLWYAHQQHNELYSIVQNSF